MPLMSLFVCHWHRVNYLLLTLFLRGRPNRHAVNRPAATERQPPFSTPLNGPAESLMDIPATSLKLQYLMMPMQSSLIP